jgi:hypothetical protein
VASGSTSTGRAQSKQARREASEEEKVRTAFMGAQGRLLATGAVIAVLLTGSAAMATIPDSTTGVISGCYHASKGDLRVIDAESGVACSKSENPLAWNQAGPPGPQGPQGPAGEVDIGVFVHDFAIQPGQSRASVSCPDGWEATGGGYHITGFPIDFQKPWVAGSGLDMSTDDPLNHPKAWFIDVFNESAIAPISGRLWVMCLETPTS